MIQVLVVSSEIDRVTETSFDDDSDCHINPDIHDVDTDTESGPAFSFGTISTIQNTYSYFQVYRIELLTIPMPKKCYQKSANCSSKVMFQYTACA